MTKEQFAQKLYDDTMRFLNPPKEEIEKHQQRMIDALLEALAEDK